MLLAHSLIMVRLPIRILILSISIFSFLAVAEEVPRNHASGDEAQEKESKKPEEVSSKSPQELFEFILSDTESDSAKETAMRELLRQDPALAAQIQNAIQMGKGLVGIQTVLLNKFKGTPLEAKLEKMPIPQLRGVAGVLANSDSNFVGASNLSVNGTNPSPPQFHPASTFTDAGVELDQKLPGGYKVSEIQGGDKQRYSHYAVVENDKLGTDGKPEVQSVEGLDLYPLKETNEKVEKFSPSPRTTVTIVPMRSTNDTLLAGSKNPLFVRAASDYQEVAQNHAPETPANGQESFVGGTANSIEKEGFKVSTASDTDRLVKLIRDQYNETNKPVDLHLIAHGTGGIVRLGEGSNANAPANKFPVLESGPSADYFRTQTAGMVNSCTFWSCNVADGIGNSTEANPHLGTQLGVNTVLMSDGPVSSVRTPSGSTYLVLDPADRLIEIRKYR